ncbi:MAG: bifunctional UDP-glucuronic acid decarboxylase/UDP-4-amino-4-deoxy-L-arabinose formyltransferase [Methanosaeta sp. PtaU1.Bin112]|nr:MAG: bifunctional UDP-glucuronic acid decarboxylase/UDP-4-amino-4-deoxy-L-arabinose formyltransferase [Methanosaeta sp. PtaU1.Bin112]
MIWDYKKEVEAIEKNLGDLTFEDRRVLITGGAGFLGSWMCDILVHQGAKVVCVDNLASGLKSNIAHLLDLENFRFIEHDISEPIFLEEKLDLVVHMASRASPFEFEHYPIEILKANTIGLMNSLEIAKKNQARLLYTSTSETYGNPLVVPTPESYYGNVNAIGPRGCYDEAKRCGEAYVTAYKNQFGLDTRMARIFNTYGPRMRFDGIYGRAIPRFIDQALNDRPITVFGDGSQTRSFTYLTDQIEGLLKLACLEEARGSVINIGNDKETTILDMAKKVLEITRSRSEITFHPLPKDDPLRRKPVITRAEEVLGWQPKVPLQDGLARTIEWYKSSK